jgi:hypothetical protein
LQKAGAGVGEVYGVRFSPNYYVAISFLRYIVSSSPSRKEIAMSAKSLAANQCNHINARGRRCRMLVASDEDSFCSHHLAQ